MTKSKEIVFPGDILSVEGAKPRNGAYKNQDGVYASCYFGTLQVSDQLRAVPPPDPGLRRYCPQSLPL